MNLTRELAKFGSGVTAWESVVHASLWLSGTTVTIWGITLTPQLNAVQTVVPALVSVALGLYAWAPRNRHRSSA